MSYSVAEISTIDGNYKLALSYKLYKMQNEIAWQFVRYLYL